MLWRQERGLGCRFSRRISICRIPLQFKGKRHQFHLGPPTAIAPPTSHGRASCLPYRPTRNRPRRLRPPRPTDPAWPAECSDARIRRPWFALPTTPRSISNILYVTFSLEVVGQRTSFFSSVGCSVCC